MVKFVTLVFALLVLAAIGACLAYAQAVATPAIETVQVTYGAAGAIVLGALSLGGAVVACTVWIVGAVGEVRTHIRTHAAVATARLDAHEKRHDTADERWNEYFSTPAPHTASRRH